jgi:hypothetical protein
MGFVEFMDACNTFVAFGKIKDIDFENELWGEEINEHGLTIRGIDFEDNIVTLGHLVPFGCGEECCGSYWENNGYDLDELENKGHLCKLIDMMDDILSVKTGI